MRKDLEPVGARNRSERDARGIRHPHRQGRRRRHSDHQRRAHRRRLRLAQTLGLSDNIRMIPIVDPVVTYSVGLVVPQRDPMTPLVATLVQIAREVAPTLAS